MQSLVCPRVLPALNSNSLQGQNKKEEVPGPREEIANKPGEWLWLADQHDLAKEGR